ncbi:MAG: hemerythrin domain-containing protein [Burkholderiaceae bacterium]|nr:hemerythrin domain-containing protein [Burkholderiaceae bacterium]
MSTSTSELHSQPSVEASAPAAASAAGRHDLYAGIHKALRLFMSRTLCELGSTDPGNPDEVKTALGQLERLLGLCELHLTDENEFIHPALERARPGSAARIATEHVHHAEAIADLRDLAGLVADSSGAVRAAACGRLYRALALFVAENFQHMQVEETAHNALLWAHYSDAELAAIEQALVASIPPAAMAEALHWFLPALNAPERAAMLAGMQLGMPPEPFAAVLEIARRTLSVPAHAALMRSLGLPPVPGLVTV